MPDPVKSWPVAPRPFFEEAFRSWLGRVATRYQISVGMLWETSTELELPNLGKAGWILFPPVAASPLDRLSKLARVSSTVPNSISCCKGVAIRLQPSGFPSVLVACPEGPRKIVTDQPRSLAAAKAGIPELKNVKHVCVKASARVNNRAENSHQPTRERERRMRGFREPERTQAFLSRFGPIRQHFALKRHLLRASLYRKQLGECFSARRRFTELSQNPSGF